MTYLRNYAVLNVKDRLARIEGVGQVLLLGCGDYSMRVWLDPRKVAERGLSAGDVVRAIRERERAGRRRRRSAPRPAPDQRRPAALDQRAGPPADRGGVRRHHRQDRAGGAVTRLRDVARLELGASEYALRSLLDNKPAVAIADLRRARRQRARRSPTTCARTMAEIKKTHARGRRLPDRLRPDAVRARLDQGGGADAARSDRARGAGGDPLPADLARLDHPAGGGAGVDRRHLRAAATSSASRSTRSRLFGLVLAIGIVVDDAIVVVENVERNIEAGLSPRDATYRAMREVTGPDHRHRAGAGRGVRAARLHQRPVGPVLQAVRADHRHLDGDLGDQLAHPLARAGRAAAEGHDAPRTAHAR